MSAANYCNGHKLCAIADLSLEVREILNCDEFRAFPKENYGWSFGYPTNTPPEALLQANNMLKSYFKAKSDFVQEPIPESALKGIWKRLFKEDGASMIWNPFGGMMSKISEFQTPFPRRKGDSM
ncbi:hypothetical protein OIU76_025447 [Salix suchowensis]|nr:hypothetical protein OIU76_025447 [Salix suchowensis]